VEKFPLLVELEPLFQCNLACSFCRKIQYPELPRAALTNVMLFRRESNKYQVV
jgi:MoaA/NifB/PqqE/SkfB family radical SAM enzyme